MALNGPGNVTSGSSITGTTSPQTTSRLQVLEKQLGDANAKLKAAPQDWSPASKAIRKELTTARDAIASQIAQLKGGGTQAPGQTSVSTTGTAPKLDPKVIAESRISAQMQALPKPYTGGADPTKLGNALYDRTMGRIGTDEQFVYRSLELAHLKGNIPQVNAAVGQRLRAQNPGIDQDPQVKANPKDGYIRYLIGNEMSGSEAQRAKDFLETGADQFRSSSGSYLAEGAMKTFDSIGDGLHDKPLQTAAMIGGAVVAGVAVTAAAPVVAAAAGIGMLAYAGGKVVKNGVEVATAKTKEERATNLVELGGAASETAMASLGAAASVRTLKGAMNAAGEAETTAGAVKEFLTHGSKLKGLGAVASRMATADDTAALADTVHADWQATARASGKTDRFKPMKLDGAQVEVGNQADLTKILDARGIPKELQGNYRIVGGKVEENILGLPNRWLAPNNAGENNASAKVVTDIINQQLAKGGKLDANFIEKAADHVHVKWLERNGSWAPAEQKLPYAQLSAAEQAKDRDMVLLGLKQLAQ